MGILTNPNMSGSGWTHVLMKYSMKLSWLCFLAGIIGFLVFPHAEFSHKTYFSENALLPGLVKGEFDEDVAIDRYLEGLKEEASNYPQSVPFPWLEAMLKQLGLEVYKHNFTLDFPLGESKSFTGQNIYAIMRAPRASSTEALVFSVPYRPPFSVEQGTDASIAVLLASAKFFRRQYYWAKDIIFLITQHEQLGVQAWLEAYHQKSCGSGILNFGDLEARAGNIQAAINLEISEPRITHFNIKVEGLNGQLPNLDLVNLVNRLCMREGVGQMFQGTEDHSRPESWNGYKRSLKTLMQMVTKQASGVPSGNHGLFHRFGIEALTIEGVMKKGKKKSSRVHEVGMFSVGRVMEGIFRSLNNLLERFHQSFFFYLLPSSSRYVSIGMYMPAFGFLGGSLVIAAFGMWLQCAEDEKESLKKKLNKTDDELALPVVIPSAISSVLPTILMAHTLGLLMLFLPQIISYLGTRFQLEAEDAVGLGFLAFTICLVLLPFTFKRSIMVLSEDNWKILKCLTLLEMGILAFTVSLCNFSLAFISTAIYAPVALIASPSQSFLKRGLKAFLILLAHPLSLVFFACSVDNFLYTEGFNVFNFAAATKRALMYSITDSYIFGNINFTIATVFLLPCWYVLWCLTFVPVTTDVKEIEGEDKPKTD